MCIFADMMAPIAYSWSARMDGYYILEQHGDGSECYDLATAKAKCQAAVDCWAIATKSNVCGGKYRVSHGAGARAVYYGDWKSYNLWAYKLDRTYAKRTFALYRVVDVLVVVWMLIFFLLRFNGFIPCWLDEQTISYRSQLECSLGRQVHSRAAWCRERVL